MADLATLQTKLADAETAYHQLLIGNKMVEIRVNGRWLQKTPADAPQLKNYIKELRSDIARLDGTGSRRSPIGLHV